MPCPSVSYQWISATASTPTTAGPARANAQTGAYPAPTCSGRWAPQPQKPAGATGPHGLAEVSLLNRIQRNAFQVLYALHTAEVLYDRTNKTRAHIHTCLHHCPCSLPSCPARPLHVQVGETRNSLKPQSACTGHRHASPGSHPRHRQQCTRSPRGRTRRLPRGHT